MYQLSSALVIDKVNKGEKLLKPLCSLHVNCMNEESNISHLDKNHVSATVTLNIQ